MNLTDKGAIVLLVTILLGMGTAPTFAQQTPFDRLINKFRAGDVFHAVFQHQYVDSYTGDTVATNGTIWVGENEYKVQNDRQTVVVDGETSRVYDKSRNRVIISKYEPKEDDFAPSRFLNGTDTTYTIQKQKQTAGQTLIVLSSDDPFSIFQRVEITLGEALVPRKIFARDQADNLITTVFKSGSFMTPQDELFVLNYPTDAEIIDMRN